MKDQDKTVVCFVTGSAGDWGGASRVLYTNLRLLDRRRIEPILLLPRDGPITAELDQLNLRYHIWGSPTEPEHALGYLWTLLRALWLYRQDKVALVHFNHRTWRPAEALAARLLGIPILVHFHVVNETRSPVTRWARAAVGVSEFVCRHSQPPELEKMVVHNPVSLARFAGGRSLRDSLRIPTEQVVVSFIGQIRDIKGVEDFIAMARSIVTPHLSFLIAGECRDPQRYPGAFNEDDLNRMIGDDPRIRYIGYIDRVEDVYTTSDIVVVPSRWQEPLGLIGIEAGACAKPVVATSVGGLPEVVIDGCTGFLVPPRTPDALAARVRQLATDATLRHRLGEAGRLRIEQHFAEYPVRGFEEILVQLAKKPRPTSGTSNAAKPPGAKMNAPPTPPPP